MKLFQVSVTRRRPLAFTLIRLLAVILLSQSVWAQNVAAQQSKRTLEIKIPKHVPLEVKLKKDSEDKALDLNNKNWLEDIKVEVTNTSEKPIYFLSLWLLLTDVRNEVGGPILFPMMYGRSEFTEQDVRPLLDDVPIAAKATHVFAVEKGNNLEWQTWRVKNNQNEPLKLELVLNYLSFGDGTGFVTYVGHPIVNKKP